MWPEFKDHPMRKDYVEPDDFDYEPTAHDSVLARATPMAQSSTVGPGNRVSGGRAHERDR